MTSIPDCLAAFSVAAMMNSDEAEAKGRAAIDAYLIGVGDDPGLRLAALNELRAAYRELALDSTAALGIRQDLEARIVELGSRAAQRP